MTARRLATLGLCLCSLAGCFPAAEDNFYTLGAQSPLPGGSPAMAKAAYSVAVGAVTLPEMVDRPQLVLGLSASRVHILEQQRWAEPLKMAMPRVIMQDLAPLLGGARVSAYPQNAAAAADYWLVADVLRFESDSLRAATIEMQWQVKPSHGEDTRYGHSLVTEPVQGKGYDALVAAYDRALAAIVREMAATIRELAGSGAVRE